ncbi:hypothetical protein ACHOLT_02540 [Desulfitobacterium sp. Sab5]|uniref:hypothetical protein n=1 Tax=Desulfitobacterium nosdiversum TaxID=3375356 RepID=UPI003CF92BC4
MPITPKQAYDGKAAEHIVISELLKNEYIPFIPLLDRGVDIVVKSKRNEVYYEIQVKSNNSPETNNQKWFVFSGGLQVRDNLIYVLVDMVEGEIWVIPSCIIKEYGNQCKSQFDLHLKLRIKGQGITRGELLEKYKYRGNWDLIEG